MNYTKGEWKVQEVTVQEYGGAIKHYYITGFIGSKTDRTIADVGCWLDRDNALEDAHLIAAAPDMYEALKDAQHWFTKAKACIPLHSATLGAIDKALAKVVGK